MIRGLAGSIVVGVFAVACATGAFDPKNHPVGAKLEELPPGEYGVIITGMVRDSNSDRPLPGALVILQCTCLSGSLEMRTDERGLYRFWRSGPPGQEVNLPAGRYTVQVLIHHANVNKSMDVPAGSRFRSNFVVDPEARFMIT